MPVAKKLPTPDDYRCRFTLPIRFRDLDAMRHVNNAVYVTYFEIGRQVYLKEAGYPKGADDPIIERFPFIVAEITCRYHSPARLDDPLLMHLGVSRIGTKSFHVEYLMTCEVDQRAIATGTSVQVYYDYAAQRTIPVPNWFAELIETYEGRPLRTK